jgi:hypothetical protein
MKNTSFKRFKHTGIITDLPPEEVPVGAWTGGLNVQFQDTATRRVGGYAKFGGTPLAAPIFCISVLKSGLVYWIYCSVDGIFITDGQTHTDITPTAGLGTVTAGQWTGCVLNGIPVLNNAFDAPVYYDFSTECQTLPGWPATARCKAIRAFKYHLFALNITDNSVNFPDSLWWSSAAAPGAIPATWIPAVDNDAGDMVLADTPGVIVDGLSMRDSFIVYKDFSTYTLSFVAGQYVYTVRKNFLTTGLQSNNCIVEVNGNHWVFTGTDVIRHDGQSFESVVQNKIKEQLTALVDPAHLDQCCIVAKASTNQVWICIPEANQNHLSKAYVINTLTLECGIRALPLVSFVGRGIVQPVNQIISWDSDTETWVEDATMWNQAPYSPQFDSFLMADSNSMALWSCDTSDSNDGQPVYAAVERLSLPINDTDTILRKMVTRVLPRIEGEPGDIINIRVGSQAFFSQAIAWGQPQPFVIGQTVGINCQLEGRLISINFSGSTMRIWKIHSYMLEFTDQGLY